MSKHFKYLSYIVRHKWFVFIAGLRVGVSPWLLIIHDWSKFLPSEWFPYVESFYGGWGKNRPEWVKAGFDRAWLHHQHHNPHHWQHWMLREDSGSVKLLQIPIRYAREMVADWMGAGRAITGKWEAVEWYAKNREVIQLHPQTRVAVEQILGYTHG